MKKRLICAVLLSASILAASTAEARRHRRGRRSVEDAVDTSTLKSKLLNNMPHALEAFSNGMKAFAVRYPSPGVVAYQIPVRVGSRNEPQAGKTGFAHFFEHLMFRGTKNRDAKQFSELYAKLGVENNAWTSYDMTTYHGVCSPKALEQVLEAEADRFMNLHFDEKGLRDEAGAVLGEYNKDIANPESVLEEKLQELAFTKHTYGHTTMGYKEDILKFGERYNDVWPFFHRYYRPLNTSVVIVGDIDPKRAIELIKKHFTPWRNALTSVLETRPEHLPSEPAQNEPRERKATLEKPSQTRLAIAYKTPAFASSSGDFAALQTIAEAAFSDVAPFAQKYRYELKWVDSISASVIESIDPGLWKIGLRLSDAGKPHERELIDAVQAALNELADQSIPAAKLTEVRNRLINERMVGWFSSPEQLAAKISWYMTLEKPENVGFPVLDRVLDSIKAVKAADVRSFVKNHLTESKRNVLILRGADR